MYAVGSLWDVSEHVSVSAENLVYAVGGNTQLTVMRWRPMPPTWRGPAGHIWTRLGTFGRDCSVYIVEGPRACGPGAQVRLRALRAEPADSRV